MTSKATSNISAQAIQFVRYTMMPWVTNWEQELNCRFTRAELAGYYVRFNLTGLYAEPQERAQFYHFITDGWMSRNEARAFEDNESG